MINTKFLDCKNSGSSCDFEDKKEIICLCFGLAQENNYKEKHSTQVTFLHRLGNIWTVQLRFDLFVFFWSVIGGTSNLKDFGWNETSLKQLECFENDFDLFYSVNRNSFEVFGQNWMRKFRSWNDLWPNDTEMCKTKRFELKWFNTNQFVVWSIGEINSLEKIQSEKNRFEKKIDSKAKSICSSINLVGLTTKYCPSKHFSSGGIKGVQSS